MIQNLKIDIQDMKLGEQEEFELLANCSIMDVPKRGLSGRRMAALIYIFAKRQNPNVTFEECLNLNMEQASEMLVDGDDPKGSEG